MKRPIVRCHGDLARKLWAPWHKAPAALQGARMIIRGVDLPNEFLCVMCEDQDPFVVALDYEVVRDLAKGRTGA